MHVGQDLVRAGGSRASTYGELGARYGNREADRNIAPFLCLLRDHGLIDCDTSPKDASLATRIKVQKLVYLAQRRFGLEFRYSHSLYIYGPYSVGLANDYYRIQDIRDAPRGGLERWGKKDDFLSFVTGHNDVKWLEIACTVIFVHDVSQVDDRDELLEHVQLIKHEYSMSRITRVYDDLVSAGMV